MTDLTLDFGSQLHFLWALLPEVVVSVTGILVLLLDVFRRGSRGGPASRLLDGIALGGIALAAAANGWLATVTVEGTSSMIAVDGFRIVLNFIVLGVTALALLYSFDWLEREDLRIGEFHFLVLMAAVGMMVLAGTRDLVIVFVAVELMSLSVYALTGLDRRQRRSAEAALKYFLVGAFASGFLLYGIALIFGAVGSTNLSLVTTEIARGTAERNFLLYAGVALLLVGLGFKVSAVPFHMWTPDAYEGAPTPVTAFMAAGVKAAGFAVILRIVVVELAAAAPLWQGIVWWLAMLTMIVPNLVALAQDDVKRMLAYSSIAHAGYLLVGIAAGGAAGRSATLFYLAVYAIMTVGSFSILYVVAGKGDARGRLADFRGLGWRRPFLGLALVVFLLSLAGFPPTGGFIGKLYLLQAALEGDQAALAVTLVLTSLISYYYYLRVVWKMYFEEAPADAPLPARPGPAFRFAAVFSVAAILVIGLFPGHGIRVAAEAGAGMAPRAAAARAPGAAPDPVRLETDTPDREPAPARTTPGRT
ncbi:MAG: NADH-quinone oxidoreductase subunit N [Gemmatimonadota bacterium]|nr:NADH-quinone oxidoreductase subunit N [Gemmatimonadota bacterium]